MRAELGVHNVNSFSFNLNTNLWYMIKLTTKSVNFICFLRATSALNK